MSSIFKWVTNCFNYYVFGQITDELTHIITESHVDHTVKQDLISSIMTNQPDRFSEQIKTVPNQLRNDLMASLMRASQLYSNPMESFSPVPPVPPVPPVSPIPSKDWKLTFNYVIEQLVFEMMLKLSYKEKKDHQGFLESIKIPENCLLHTSKIISSDQFKPHKSEIKHKKLLISSPKRDMARFYARTLAQLKLRLFIKNRRQKMLRKQHFVKVYCPVAKKNWRRVYERVLAQMKLKLFLKKKRAELRQRQKVIHTSQIIPSGQFKPYNSHVEHKELIVSKPVKNWLYAFDRVMTQLKLWHFIRIRRQEMAGRHYNPQVYWPLAKKNWHRSYERVLAQLKLKFFLKKKRVDVRQRQQVIHTGQLIPSDQFKPYNSHIEHKKLVVPKPVKNWLYAFDRVLKQLQLWHFIRARRNRSNWNSWQEMVRCPHNPQVFWPVAKKDWHRSYERVLAQLKLRFFLKKKRTELRLRQHVIHTGKLIPSDQFKPHHYVRLWHDPVVPFTIVPQHDWKKKFNRVIEQLKMKQFINVHRQEMTSDYVEIRFNDNRMAGSIIPSDQFVPVSTQIMPYETRVPIPCEDWVRAKRRVLEQLKLHHYVKVCRYIYSEHKRCEEARTHPNEQVIHTSKIIRSGCFVPVSKPIVHKVITVSNPPRDWRRAYTRVVNNLKLKQFINERREEKKKRNVSTFQVVMSNLVDPKFQGIMSDWLDRACELTNYIRPNRLLGFETPRKEMRHRKHSKHHNNRPYKETNKSKKNNQFLKLEHKWNQHYI